MSAIFPKGFVKYIKVCKSEGCNANQRFVNFATRYKFAGQLEGISVHGYSEITQQIYLEALRVSLAYSALESLNKVIPNMYIRSIIHPELSVVYKSSKFAKLRALLEQSTVTKLSNRLTAISNSAKNADLLPVVEAIRHLTFHGILNASNSGLGNSAGLSFLQELSFSIFSAMDEKSEEISDQLLNHKI